MGGVDFARRNRLIRRC